MTASRTASFHRSRPLRAGVAALSLALLGTPALVGRADAAAAAATGPTTAGPAPCLAGQARVSNPRGAADTPGLSKAVKERVQRDLAAQGATNRSFAARTGTTALPAQVRVPVQIHVIHGRHKKDRKISRTQARRLFYTLRAAFNGRQNTAMAPTGIIFELNKITVSRNDAWFHARPSSRADRQMKRTLHRGKRRVLNVYLNNARSQGQALLGFARFPWLAGPYPKLDGVTINVETLPGGKARGYNLGDTIVHETGHWLGLFHTFEGGCEAPGDYVTDTAAEGEPSFTCPRTRDTCETEMPEGWMPGDPEPERVYDPVTNFMDYSYDSCMSLFTPGQRARMMTLFLRYRYGK